MTVGEMGRLFAARFNAESDNSLFSRVEGRVREFLSDATRQIERAIQICQGQANLTTESGTARYELASLITAPGVEEYDVFRERGGVVYPGQYDLDYLTEKQYDRLSHSGSMWGFTLKVDRSEGKRYLYIQNTPGSVVNLLVNYWLVEAEFTSDNDVPLFPGEHLSVAVGVAVRIARASLGILGDYAVEYDPEVRKLGARKAAEMVNTDRWKRGWVPQYSGGNEESPLKMDQ